jgi:hypothetical protein
MRCKWSAPDAERLAIAVMAPAEAEAYRAHLSGCSDCQAEVGRSERLEAAVHAAFSEVATPAGAVERMLASLPARVPAPPPWRRRPVRYAAALAGAVALLFVALNPQAVISLAATVRQTFYFIPGIGIRATTDETLVLEQPVSETRSGVTLRVVSVFTEARGTTLTFEVLGMPGGKDAYKSDLGRLALSLVDNSGRRYPLQVASFGVGGSMTENHARGTAAFAPLPRGVREITLRAETLSPPLPKELGGALGSWALPFALIPTSEAKLALGTLQGVSASHHGLTLRLEYLARTPDEIVAHVSAYGPRAKQVESLKPRDSSVRSERSVGAGAFDVYATQPVSRLEIARIEIIEPGKASVDIALPDHDKLSLALGVPVRLGRHTLLLERGELLSSTTLRVYYRTGPAVDGARLLWNQPKQSTSGVYHGDEGTGYFMVTINALNRFTKRVVLDFENPRVLVEGPWELPLN